MSSRKASHAASGPSAARAGGPMALISSSTPRSRLFQLLLLVRVANASFWLWSGSWAFSPGMGSRRLPGDFSECSTCAVKTWMKALWFRMYSQVLEYTLLPHNAAPDRSE